MTVLRAPDADESPRVRQVTPQGAVTTCRTAPPEPRAQPFIKLARKGEDRMSTQSAASGRARSPRGQGEQLRREILRAVGRLLDEWGGVEKLTMRAVAREVGVAAPSIYLHFSDKAELVWAALADKYEDLATRMRAADAATADGGANARERLRAQAHAYCLFAREYPGHYRLMYEVRQPPVPTARLHLHPSRHVSLSLREAFARCREEATRCRCPTSRPRRHCGRDCTVSSRCSTPCPGPSRRKNPWSPWPTASSTH